MSLPYQRFSWKMLINYDNPSYYQKTEQATIFEKKKKKFIKFVEQKKNNNGVLHEQVVPVSDHK